MVAALCTDVAADPPDGLIIDTTGADHLHGGEDAMLEGLVSRMASFGIVARAAVADTWGAAHACARFLARPTFVAPAGKAAAIVRDLPIGALRLPSEIVESLHALGFERVGEVEAAPRLPHPALRTRTRPPSRPGHRPAQ